MTDEIDESTSAKEVKLGKAGKIDTTIDVNNESTILSIERHDYSYNILEAKCYVNNNRVNITFYRHPTNIEKWGTEIYMGENYLTDDVNTRSYSRNYKQWKDLPGKYLKIVQILATEHGKVQWSETK